ncbi:dTDP-4-dehydrorhamnose reductase [Hyphococcus flavus]|uniref:dTDP-4-dehydrorhamnose reductase n=1 Tax=Hyphococcus flavus TaxID=1866326 RepID=A0AAE9ZCK1_9PROT|nr:dTDP-4-dehydrorhamnose reductase [Hyphococcus flavus]WDI32349.1 dTDP-4-dehydrorhamnose reductase [Hyphococcus flavus]
MRTLVFGKSGQVARALADLVENDTHFLFLGHGETDLSEPDAGGDAVAEYSPDVVINAAAYTAVDKAESKKGLAHNINAQAVERIAAACKNTGAQFIHISTDYVFDGNETGRYSETSITNPANAYGQSKLAGEEAAIAAYAETIVVRTSWIFSEYGSNFVKTMLRLARERNELSIVSDQIGGPTDARDIAKALLAIVGKKHRGGPGAGVYHFQGAPAVSWADFARKIFEINGNNTAVTAIPTSQYPTPARRPLNTVLDCAKIERDFGIGQPDWRASLRRVIDALKQKEERT